MKKTLVDATNNVQNLSLKNLKFIANIAVKTDAFSKDSFFGKDGLVKLYFWDNFTNLISSPMPDEIPAFEGNLLKTRLTKRMYDSEILNELGHFEPFTISEFLAIIKDLLQKQCYGYANIFYVRLENKQAVAVDMHWNSVCREWDLRVLDLSNHRWRGDHRWSDGYCVFSPS